MGGKRMRAGGGDGGEEGEVEDSEPSYEAERKAILEENRKRMLELGLLDASNLFPAPAPKTPRKLTPKPTVEGPPRRSSRVRAAPELYKPPIPPVHRRVIARGPAPSPREEYTGPRRRSSRLQGPRVSYKDQLQYDSDPEEVVETTKKEALPLQHTAGSAFSQESGRCSLTARTMSEASNRRHQNRIIVIEIDPVDTKEIIKQFRQILIGPDMSFTSRKW